MTEQADLHLRPKLIGARIKRTEDPRLLTGLGSFVDDRQLAGVITASDFEKTVKPLRATSRMRG